MKLEEQGEGEGRDGAAPGPVRVPAPPGPRAALTAAPAMQLPALVPAPAPNHVAPPVGPGAGASGVTLVRKEVEEAETLGQQRDRLALALAHGPVRVDAHIKVVDSTSGEDTDGNGLRVEEEEEEATGGKGGDGEGEVEEAPGGEGGLVLLAGAAHAPEDDGGSRGAPRRRTPADRAARAKRGRGAVAVGDDVPDAPAPKRHTRAAQAGKSGRHGVTELTGLAIQKATPWLTWCARLMLPGDRRVELGYFATADHAARAYDAEVRRRGWAHVKQLNFPQPEEPTAYPQAGEERCDERGLPLLLAPEPPADIQVAAAAHGASSQRPPKLSGRNPGKSGFFGVTKDAQNKCYKATPWLAFMIVPASGQQYALGHFTAKKEAARAYDAEVRRRGWTHLKRLNFPDPADDAALPPPPLPLARRPGPHESRGAGLALRRLAHPRTGVESKWRRMH